MGETDAGRARDAALVRAGLAGDLPALEQLFRPYERSLVGFCYGVLGNVEDAEDAAQETFLKALRALPRFRGEAAFRSWLFRIALHLCLEWKRTRHPVELLDDTTTPAIAETASPESIVLSHLRLREALETLPPRRRAILLLKEWEGCSLEEIAGVMGWNETRVKNELYQARRALVEWQRQEEGGQAS